MAEAEGTGRRFRPEIEGLRAVAAVLVVLYHVFSNRVSGGVDVFFVLAGFLITTSLIGHVEGSGRIDAERYFARLGTRLLPLALLTLAAVSVATLLWMPVTREAATFGEIGASALYVENWVLAINAVDYTAREAAQSPVQHFWAVSVQGQFYLLWLVLFAGVLVAAGRSRFRRWLGAALVAVFLVSLLFSVVLTRTNQPFAYFHTATRAWEFAAGGLLVLLAPRIAAGIRSGGPWASRGAAAAGWLGLGVILATGLVIQVATEFPGWVALIPVSGAMLVLIGGGTGLWWASDRLLGSRPFVFVGGVAYALYLWHWPVLVFYGIVRRGPVGPVAGFGIIALSFMLAVVTTWLVERPIRTRLAGNRPSWRVAGSGMAAMVAVAVTAGGLASATTPPRPPESLDAVAYPGAAAMADDYLPTVLDVPFAPVPGVAGKDMTAIHKGGCITDIAESEPGRCVRGDPEGDVTVMLVGGSHATQWFPALDPIARERGWKLVTAVKTGCRLMSGPFLDTDEGRSCRDWNRTILEDTLQDPPDMLITTVTVTSPTDEWVPDGYRDVWVELMAAGVPIVGIRDNPRSVDDVPDCLSTHLDDPAACDIPRTIPPRDESPSMASLPSAIHVVDLTEWLCDDTTCPAVIGNVTVYRDRHHFTANFVRTMIPMLDRQLPEPNDFDAPDD